MPAVIATSGLRWLGLEGRLSQKMESRSREQAPPPEPSLLRRAAIRGADVDVHVLPVDGRVGIGSDSLHVGVVLRQGNVLVAEPGEIVGSTTRWAIGGTVESRARTELVQTLKSSDPAAPTRVASIYATVYHASR